MARGNKAGASKEKSSNTTKTLSKDETNPDAAASRISQGLQQQCLDIFREAFQPSPDDFTTLQEVKGRLFQRDFAAAFGRQEYLRVYASRWSPSRALGYLQILESVGEYLTLSGTKQSADNEDSVCNVVCLGGGAGSELIALAGWLRLLQDQASEKTSGHFNVSLVDIADWTEVTETLRSGIVTAPEVSKYASQARKDANEALLQPTQMNVNFQQEDVLAMDEKSLNDLLQKADLLTVMFTLNELYSTSMPKTQTLLSRLATSMRPGSLVLVVDSPGSYSTVSINGGEKKYPMQWLLDLTLRGPTQKSHDSSANTTWERLIVDNSRWFRVSETLQYPIDLENMRYQVHLYRRKAESGD